MEALMARGTKVRGDTLDRLCDDKVFYVERGNGGFLVVEGCNSAYSTKLSPVELIELVVAGTGTIREHRE